MFAVVRAVGDRRAGNSCSNKVQQHCGIFAAIEAEAIPQALQQNSSRSQQKEASTASSKSIYALHMMRSIFQMSCHDKVCMST